MKSKIKHFSFIHPIYLNTSMLMSFVATMEDGVTLGSSVVQSSDRRKNNELSVDGEGGTNEILSVLGLRLNATGELSRSSEKETSVEETFTRQHTMASLFSRLLQGLTSNGFIKEEPEISSIECGDLVSFEAMISENPLDRMLNASKALLELLQNGSIAPNFNGAKPPAGGRGSNGGRHTQNSQLKETEKIISAFREDQESSPLIDLVGTSDRFQALITADREFFNDSSRESLIGGRFRVVGKVSGVLAGKDSSVSLFRRGTTSLGPMRVAMEDMVKMFQDSMGSEVSVETTVKGPVVQVLPLAIYI